MSSVQQKEARQPQSFSYNEDSPTKPRVITTSNATDIDTKYSAGNRVISQPVQSRTRSPQPQLSMTNTNATHHNRIYYSQVYGKQDQGVTVFYNQLSPGQIHRKPIEQLQYQNGVLLQQLQQRDEVIAMFKSGWTPDNLPINDQIVKSLNFQLAQKNVLIQQFHRSLAQFEETIKRENIQLSIPCTEQFHRLQTLIIRHEHYPILITQRIIETSRQAETIYIKDTTVIQEYIFKLEQSYKEVTILREKLIWFEKEHQGLEVVIANLKAQLEQSQIQYSASLQEINNLRLQLQQFQNAGQGQINQYQSQIAALKQRIAQLEAQSLGSGNEISSLKQQINVFITEINTYKQQISVYITQINGYKAQLGSLQGELGGYKQQAGQLGALQNQINVYLTEINNYKVQIGSLQNELNGYKQQGGQINALQNQLASLRQQINVYITEINNYKVQIGSLQNQNNGYKQQGGQINGLQNEIASLKQQINVYITEINNYKVQIGSLSSLQDKIGGFQNENGSLRQQINIYITEINNYKQEISMYQSEISNWKQQFGNLQNENGNLKQQLNVYITEINNYKTQIQNLTVEINSLKQQLSGKSDSKLELDNLRGQINNYIIQINNYKQKINVYLTQIDNYQQQILILKGENDDLRRQIGRASDCGHAGEISSYKQQISSLTLTIQQDSTRYSEEIERLNREISRLRREANKSNLQQEIQKLQQQIYAYEQEISTLNRKINSQFDIQWELDNLRRENQRLKGDNSKLKRDNEQLEDEINRLNQEILKYKSRISRLEGQSSNESLEWKSKYEQSQTIIRKLKIQIEEYTLSINVGGQWRSKYESLQIKYNRLLEEVQYYKLEYQKIQNKLAQQESALRNEHEGQLNYKLTLLQQRLRRQIREEITIQITIQITNRLKAQYEVKLNESYKNLTQAQEYIKTLLAKIEELEITIVNLNKQINDYKNKPAAPAVDVSPYERKIGSLEEQLARALAEIQSLSRQLQQAEQYILQLQEQQRQVSNNDELIITIQELTAQITDNLRQINEITSQKQDLQLRYRQLELEYNSTKEQLNLIIKRLNEQIDALKRQLAEKSDNKEWEREKKELVDKYERELKERWDQLKKAEEYIATYTRESQQIITYLEQRIRELEQELKKSGGAGKDEYLYLIDARYEQIRKRLLTISTQTAQSITSESQYWQSYKLKRKQEIQVIQQTINESLVYMSQIQQAIVVKRDQLHRLDFTKLDTILSELEKLQKGKAELTGQVKEQFESRFYGVLKSVSTSIEQ